MTTQKSNRRLDPSWSTLVTVPLVTVLVGVGGVALLGATEAGWAVVVAMAALFAGLAAVWRLMSDHLDEEGEEA
jgi:methenyltetrahydromethanopterin cyclohydrolase